MATTSTTLPLYFSGKVVHGAGRGGTQLGFPTANVDASCIQDSLKGLEDGVYYGYAKVDGNDGHAEPMVMSIGQNITFEDAKAKTAEVHILKKYPEDFYGSTLKVAVVGYIRGMIKFDGIQSLIDAIHSDIAIARQKFEEPDVNAVQKNSFFA